MATTSSEAAPAHAWKVPRGGERDRQAVCYWAGAFMSDELKGRGMTGLRHVPDDEIRDGSKPLTQPVSVTEQVDADWKDDAHVPEKVPELAHLNHPQNGETIDQRFNLHFIDPRACDKKIRLVFRPEEKSTEESAELKMLELETFGNQIKKKIERPQGLVPGAYTILVQMLEGEAYIDKTQVQVIVA